MKIIFVLALLGIIAFVLYRRMKPYLRIGRQVYQVLTGNPRQDLFDSVRQKAEGRVARLIRCDSCGTWVPDERVVNLRGGSTFCSQECMQTKVRDSREV